MEYKKALKQKFSKICNPRSVYEGWFETWFIRPFFHQYADFSTPGRGRNILYTLLAWLIVTLGLAGIMMGQVGLIGPEAGDSAMFTVGIVWGVLSVVPIIALLTRCVKGDGTYWRPKVLGIDILLGVSCLLFFILGLLMMITTLNSGSLNPNARYSEEDTVTVSEEEYVHEEPIFTYQDEAPAVQIEDSLQDLEDPDAVNPEETYDPTLNSEATQAIEQNADNEADSLSYF